MRLALFKEQSLFKVWLKCSIPRSVSVLHLKNLFYKLRPEEYSNTQRNQSGDVVKKKVFQDSDTSKTFLCHVPTKF